MIFYELQMELLKCVVLQTMLKLIYEMRERGIHEEKGEL